MPDVVLEALNAETWPEAARMLAWAFQSDEGRWRAAFDRLSEAWAVRGPEGVQAAYALYRTTLHVGGRDIAVGGFAGVGVRPEARGAGLATGMMAAGLRQLRAAGVPLAALYPSTLGLYRGVGFETAGHHLAYTVPTAAIRVRAPQVAVAEVDPAAIRARHEPRHGHLGRTEGLWARIVAPFGGDTRCYTVGERGYLVAWRDTDVLRVRDWQVSTPGEAARAWALLAAMSTMVERVAWMGPPDDPMLAALPEDKAVKVERWMRWMVRILDVPAALQARGWREDGVLDLEVTDPLFPENTGRWRLVVADGRATVTPGGTGALRVDIRGLAALLMAYTTPQALTTWGACAGEPGTLAAAERLFAAPTPWMPDFF